MIGRDELGHRSETVRRANLSSIVRELHGSGPLSRSDLVTRTGLTRSAIRGLIGELVAGRAGHRRARPPWTVPRADPPRSFARIRTGRSCWPSRSPSTRWRPPRSGSAGASSTSSGSTCRAVARASPTSPRPWPTSPRRCGRRCRAIPRSSASVWRSSASCAAATVWSPSPPTSAGAMSRSASTSCTPSTSTSRSRSPTRPISPPWRSTVAVSAVATTTCS